MEANPDFVDLFQQLDGMVNAFDAEGAGPLRKGESPFSWASVEKLALPLAQAAPDLRVGIWLLRAELAQLGLPGLARGLARLATWLQLPADQLHPRPEAGEPPRALHGLLLAWLTTASFLVLVREASIWHDAPVTIGAFLVSTDAATDLAHGPEGAVIDALVDSLASIRVLDTVLTLEASAADVSLASLQETLARALRHAQGVGGVGGVGGADVDPDAAGELPSAAGAEEPPRQDADDTNSPSILGGAITTREEVQATLERLAQYFIRHEPGHPALLFIRRIQKMAGASFEELLDELFPDAAQLIAKLNRPLPN